MEELENEGLEKYEVGLSCTYSSLCESEYGKRILAFVTERWSRLNLLCEKDVSEERKQELALAYEQYTEYTLICDDEGKKPFEKIYEAFDFDLISYPTIRRTVVKLPTGIFSFKKFSDYMNEMDIEALKEFTNGVHGWTKLDEEAEIIIHISDEIIDKFLKDNNLEKKE